MIKIKKDNNIKVVTQGAYSEFYEHLGYEIVNDNKKKLTKEIDTKEIDTKEVKDRNTKDSYSRK